MACRYYTAGATYGVVEGLAKSTMAIFQVILADVNRASSQMADEKTAEPARAYPLRCRQLASFAWRLEDHNFQAPLMYDTLARHLKKSLCSEFVMSSMCHALAQCPMTLRLQ